MKKKLIYLCLLVITVFSVVCFVGCKDKAPEHAHSHVQVVTQPTCTEQGYTTYTCACGDTYKDDYINATGHEFTNYVSDNNATYDNDGTKTALCNHNGCSAKDTVTDVGSKLVSLYTITLNKTTFGLSIGDRENIIPTILPSEGTQVVTWSTSKPNVATISENGTVIAVAKGETLITASYEGAKATCIVEVFDGTEITYKLTADESYYYVAGFNGESLRNLIIAREYNDLRVKAIGAEAFKDNATLESVILPNSIEVIEQNAFSGCVNLKSITIENSVKEIMDGAFQGCTSLQNVTLSSNTISLGAYAFEGCCALENIELGNKLETMGEKAFANCTSLNNIEMPNTLSSIGVGAFQKATALKSVTFSTALTSLPNIAFQGCSALQEIELLSNITSLGNSCFSDCAGIKELSILGNITQFGDSTFYLCTSLEKIYFNSATIGDLGEDNYIFYNAGINGDGITVTLSESAVIPEGLFEPFYGDNYPKITRFVIEDGAINADYFNVYNNLPYITELDIPITLQSVSDGFINAFENFSTIEDDSIYIKHIYAKYIGTNPDITVKDGTISINKNAFKDKSLLTNVTIPDSVTSISSYAFSGCSSLTEITLPFVGATKDGTSNTHFGYIFGASSYSNNSNYVPSSLKTVTITGDTSIGSYAFSGCDSLTSIVIPDGVTSIGNYAFYSCYRLTSITIPDSVTSIGDYAFTHCDSLTSVAIPDGVTSIGADAFSGCDSLTSIVIPDSVTSIGGSAFSGCDSLTSVTIGDSVESIYYQAFFGCSSLTSIVIPDSVTSISSRAFDGCSSLMRVIIGNGVTSIGQNVFDGCSSLTSVTFTDTSTWYNTFYSDYTRGSYISVTDPSSNATRFTRAAYCAYYWYKE